MCFDAKGTLPCDSEVRENHWMIKNKIKSVIKSCINIEVMEKSFLAQILVKIVFHALT